MGKGKLRPGNGSYSQKKAEGTGETLQTSG